MAKAYRFKGLLTEEGWIMNAVVHLSETGRIQSISTDKNHKAEEVDGYALPGFQNAHSHAFQYAMAGLAELHEGHGVPDDFWSWRSAMYDLALGIDPDQMEAIAAQLYAEMVRHGYTSVAEFHYVHHDKSGNPYTNRAELGERLVRAAAKAGIRITLVPMFYQKGGFGKEAEAKQRRFISNTLEEYLELLEASKSAISQYEHASLGLGIHSLRAVEASAIKELGKYYQFDLPFHIHVSEQLKEIEDCLAFYGKRPVQWLLDTLEVNEKFHLVHATHLDNLEVQQIAQSGAHVVLCPTTEGNLGDGLFRFGDFKKWGGKWSIGTDSHVSLNPLEELRLLDYGQRLDTHKRTTYYEHGNGDSGFNAIKMAWNSGREAMGHPSGQFFKMEEPFDAVVIDASNSILEVTSEKHLTNTIVYATDTKHTLGTIINGEWKSKEGKHLQSELIFKEFKKHMQALKSRY